jgi:hypothetical protein
MKKRILLVVSILLILIGIFILVKVIVGSVQPAGRGALQVTTNIKGTVFLNNNLLGPTPLCKCDQNETIESGLYDLKIVPEDKTLQTFSAKVAINPGVLTAVDRTFLPGALASSYILTLEKTSNAKPQIFIASVPDEALVSIDGESKGVTPFSLDDISASEHEIEIDKTGFSKKTIRVRAVPDYKLVLNVILGTENGGDIAPQTNTPATPSATLAPTVNPTNSVKILDTPTGFLRVRATPSTAGNEVTQVSPGETYEYVDENTSWFQIKLSDGKTGWISKTYSQKVTQ